MQTTAVKLLPCPFCGGPATIQLETYGYTARCNQCRAATSHGRYPEWAEADWNRRHTPKQRQEGPDYP